jgi:hypothetical protein
MILNSQKELPLMATAPEITDTESASVENLDQEEKQAIAAVVRARFGNGDFAAAMRVMNSVTHKRLAMRKAQVHRQYG